MDAHGQAPTEHLKGCVVRMCRKITYRCVDQFIQQYLPLLCCFMNRLIDKAQPFITPLFASYFDDPGQNYYR
ncbi:unnamed protein product [Coregonus sp. 'balchen']|nr:unnamed protein product [Coregonus sp. 'balchen']